MLQYALERINTKFVVIAYRCFWEFCNNRGEIGVQRYLSGESESVSQWNFKDWIRRFRELCEYYIIGSQSQQAREYLKVFFR